MNKKIIRGLMVGMMLLPLASCDLFSKAPAGNGGNGEQTTKPESQAVSISTVEDLNNIKSNSKVRLDSDLEIFAGEDLKKESFSFSRLSFDGNNHTITIIGNDGSVRSNSFGIFDDLTNCVFKNLTINFEMAPETKSQDDHGIFCDKLEKTLLYNVDLNFNKGFKLKASYSVVREGLIAAKAYQSYITGCDVKGDGSFFGYMASPFVAEAKQNTVIAYNRYEGDVSFAYYGDFFDEDNRAMFGCMAGYLNETSQVYGNTIKLHGLSTYMNDTTWHSTNNETGGVVGYTYGLVQDNLVQLEGDIKISSYHNSSTFTRATHMGFIAGQAKGNAKVERNLVDTSDITSIAGNHLGRFTAGIAKSSDGCCHDNYFLNSNKLVNNMETEFIEPLQTPAPTSKNGRHYYEAVEYSDPIFKDYGVEKILLDYNYKFETKDDLRISKAIFKLENDSNEYSVVSLGKPNGVYFTLKNPFVEKNIPYELRVDVEGKVIDSGSSVTNNLEFKFNLNNRFLDFMLGDKTVTYIDSLNDANLNDKGPGIIGEENINRWYYTNISNKYLINNDNAPSFDKSLEELNEIIKKYE